MYEFSKFQTAVLELLHHRSLTCRHFELDHSSRRRLADKMNDLELAQAFEAQR